MKKMLLIAGLLMTGAAVSNAGVHVSIGIGFPIPAPVYVQPAPVVVAPPPVYVPVPPPPVVYYPPPPVVVAPGPVVPAPGFYFGIGSGYRGGHHHGRPWRHCR